MSANTFLRALRRRCSIIWNGYIRWPALLWKFKKRVLLDVNGRTLLFPVRWSAHLKYAHKFRDGVWERDVIDCVCEHVRPGDVFLDIGASFGPYTLIAGRSVGPDGKVYAFEPDPNSLRQLKKNVSFNELDNVEIFDLAVSDHVGSIQMDAPSYGLGHGTTRISHQDQGDISVKSTTLHEFCTSTNCSPDIIKIDVEGAEAMIINSARDIVRKARTVILEFHEPELRELGTDPDEFFNSLFELGKEVVLLQESKRKDIGSHKNEFQMSPGSVMSPGHAPKGSTNLLLRTVS